MVQERHPVIHNASSVFVRPAMFYLDGFSNMLHTKYFYVFLCFVYIITVTANGFLITIIYLIKTLHTAKFMFVLNLAVADLCESTALIPKLLNVFLFDSRYIVYEACLSYMFFVLCFSSLQAWTLLSMAYDRFIAICFPLRYHVIMSKQAVATILVIAWTSMASLIACLVGLIDRLSFCRSLVIRSFYCDHAPTFTLACNDASLNSYMAFTAFVVILCVPFLLIVVSYVCIAVVLFRLASKKERVKAMKTCTAHMILVAICFLPIMGTNIAAISTYIAPNARIINSTLTHTIPPMVNPIIYSLKTEEILKAIKTLYTRSKVTGTLKRQEK